MNPKEAKNSLSRLLDTRRPVFFWGPPGVGKSSIVKQIGLEKGLPVRDIRAVLLDPVDLRGLPHINGDGRAHWAPPSFLPSDGEGILFLDELAQAPPLVQNACLQLALDRQVGEHRIPDGWAIVAASNRVEDRAHTHSMSTALSSRFIHVDIDVSYDCWREWALTEHINPEVVSFIDFRTDLLHDFDPDTNPRAFASPRSWEFVSDILEHPNGDRHAIVSGCVGGGPAAEFLAFLEIYNSLPDVDKVLAKPDTSKVPKEPSVLYALSGSLAERMRDAKPALQKKFVTYVERMPDAFGVLAMRSAVQVNRQIIKTASGWLKDHQDLLLD